MTDNKDKNESPTDNVKETSHSKDQDGAKKPSGPLGKVAENDRNKASTDDPSEDSVAEPHEDDRVLSWEEQEAIVGDLPPGESGFLPLDELGHIAGPAKKGNKYPDDGQRYKTIYRPAQPDRNLLLTPSGAPLTNRMQADVNPPRSEPVGGKNGTEAPKAD